MQLVIWLLLLLLLLLLAYIIAFKKAELFWSFFVVCVPCGLISFFFCKLYIKNTHTHTRARTVTMNCNNKYKINNWRHINMKWVTISMCKAAKCNKNNNKKWVIKVLIINNDDSGHRRERRNILMINKQLVNWLLTARLDTTTDHFQITLTVCLQ